MKFETPVVEIQKFDVEDILTTSGGEEPTESEYINPREGADPGYEGNCSGTMADFDMGTVLDCVG